MQKTFLFVLLLSQFLVACNNKPEIPQKVITESKDTAKYRQNPTASVTINNSNVAYVGEENELIIKKGIVSSAMLIVYAEGAGASIEGCCAKRILRAEREGTIIIHLSGEKDIVPGRFVFHAKKVNHNLPQANPTASITVNGSNILYIGEDNELDIRKGVISSAVLQVSASGGGASLKGTGAQRTMRVTKKGKVTIMLSGGNPYEPRFFTFYAKRRDKK